MTANKGRSVVTERPFFKGEFVCHYDGELIDEKEAKKRHEEYDQEKGSYMLHFIHEGRKLWSVYQCCILESVPGRIVHFLFVIMMS